MQQFSKCKNEYSEDYNIIMNLYFHRFGLNHVDLVSVAAPHFIMHDSHAADWVMGPAEVKEVVVG